MSATCDVAPRVRLRAVIPPERTSRRTLAAAALLLLTAGPAVAQRAAPPLAAFPVAGASVPALGAQEAGLARLRASLASEPRAADAVAARRSPLRTVGWTMAGAAVGAGLGFFASQVAHSNWDDSDPGSFRTRLTVSGALLGAVGGLLFSRHQDDPYASAPANQGRGRNVISTAELRTAGGQTAYDVVQSLRPVWLNSRGVDSFDENPTAVVTGGHSPQVLVTPGEAQVIIYLDGTRLGSVDRLRDMPAVQIKGMRYYDAREATLRWGSGHSHGVIELLTTELGEGGAWIRG